MDAMLIGGIFIAAIATSVLGTGGGIIALLVLLSFFGGEQGLILSAIIRVFSFGFTALLGFKTIDFRYCNKVLIGIAVGSTGALLIYRPIDTEILQAVLASYLLFGLWFDNKIFNLLVFKNRVVMGAFASALNVFTGIGGIFMSATMLRETWPKETYVSSKAHINFFIAVGSLAVYFFSPTVQILELDWVTMTVLIGVTFCGSFVGKYVLAAIPDNVVNNVFKLACTVLVLRILYGTVAHLVVI